MDDRQTTDWKWFQYRPIFLIAMTGVLILLIAGCQRPTTTHREEKAVNPSLYRPNREGVHLIRAPQSGQQATTTVFDSEKCPLSRRPCEEFTAPVFTAT